MVAPSFKSMNESSVHYHLNGGCVLGFGMMLSRLDLMDSRGFSLLELVVEVIPTLSGRHGLSQHTFFNLGKAAESCKRHRPERL